MLLVKPAILKFHSDFQSELQGVVKALLSAAMIL